MLKLYEKVFMKKKLFYIVLTALLIAGLIFFTIEAVYYYKLFKLASSFDASLFITMMAFFLLILSDFVGLFIIAIQYLKGNNKNGKDS